MKHNLLSLFICLFAISATYAQQDSSRNMTLLDNWAVDTFPDLSGVTYNDIWGYTDCDGNEYAIIGSIEKIHFFDISTPTDIKELAHFDGGGRGLWRDFKTYRDRAYAVSDGTEEGLIIFDMSNIQDTIIKTYQSDVDFKRAHNIYIDEANGRLYVVGSGVKDIHIYDLTVDPDNPVLVGEPTLTRGGYVHDVYVRDNIAYCSHGYNGYFIWNLVDPDTAVLMSALVTGGYNHSSWVTEDGKYAIFAEEVPIGLPLGTIDLTFMSSGFIAIDHTFKFPLLAPDHTQNRPHNPFVRDNYLITSYYHDGVQIFDITDPLNPMPSAFYDSFYNTEYPNDFKGVWGVYPYFPSGTIIASDVDKGLLILRADSIEWQPIERDAFPDPSVQLNGVLPLCEGSTSVSLTAQGGAEDYIWYKDGNIFSTGQNSLIVEEAGSYYLEVSNGHCTKISDTFDISSNPLPDLSSMDTSAVQFCEGESAILNAPEGFDFYIWMLDGNVVSQESDSLEVETAGNYTVLVIQDGCSMTSPTIEVDVIPSPGVSLSFSSIGPIFCPGSVFTISAENGAEAYVWKRNNVIIATDTSAINITENGLYWVEITINGCVGQSEVTNVMFHTPVVPSITEDNGTLTSTDANTYQWYLNGNLIPGAISKTYVYTESGDYTVETTDFNDCEATSEPISIIFTSTHEIIGATDLSIYPIPAQFQLNLDIHFWESSALNIRLLSIDGKQLYEQQLSKGKRFSHQIDISHLPAGLYIAELSNSKGKMYQKLIFE